MKSDFDLQEERIYADGLIAPRSPAGTGFCSKWHIKMKRARTSKQFAILLH